MRRPWKRDRLAGPASVLALVAASLAALAALYVRAGGPRPGREPSSPDALSVAYLQAALDRRPGDAGTRCRLARAQLALGLYPDAERTLAPLLRPGTEGEPALLAVDVAVAAWRAAPPGSPERAATKARALERIERLLDQDPEPAEFDHLAGMAHELGRPDLAARAHESAAALDRPGCARWLSQSARDFLAARDPRSAADAYARAYACSGDPREAMSLGLLALDAYLAAGMGAEALRLADGLVERFPGEAAVLQRAEAIALGQDDRERARRFGEDLMAMGAADAVSLGRQLDLELAAGDLAAALRVAERLAAHAPPDARSQLTAAKVAAWAGQPELALRHRLWLARHGEASEGIDAGLVLARAVGDEAAVAELLTLRSRRGPLSPAALAELAVALEKSGPPGRAVAALQVYARRHPARRYVWEELAAAQERGRGLLEAVATRREISRRFGRSPRTSVDLARLLWALDRPGDALAELRPWSESAGPGEVGYWELLAELAWDQEANDLAGRAYGALWIGGRIDAVGVERLLLLNRDAGRRGEAIRYGRGGWARFHQPRLLLLAMDEAARAGRWEDLERMTAEAARAPSVFARFQAYWLLRARLEERAGRVGGALEAYRAALAIDPRSVAARSGVIWLLAGSHDREGLSRCLAAWAADAWSESAMWPAYAAGLEELGRRREALAFYERDARADPGDGAAVKRFAAALERAGDRAAAAKVDAYLAERQLHAPSPVAPTSTSPAPNDASAGGAASGTGPDAVGAARAASGRFRSAAGAVAEFRLEAIGPVVLEQTRGLLRSEVAGAEAAAQVRARGLRSGDPLLRLPGEEIELLARTSFSALGGETEVAGGASLRSDGNLPRVGVAHARDLASFVRARLEASLHEPADESAAMLAEAVRTRVGGALTLAGGPVYARAGYDWKSWSTRAGTALGTGGATTAEAGWRTQGIDPDVRLRLQGGYQRNLVDPGPANDALAALASGAGGIPPPELAMLGAGAGASRWAMGPVRLSADGWLGWIWPPVRPAFRAQLGVSFAPFRSSELSLACFAANDRWASSRDYGVSLSVTQSFRR